MKKIFILFLLVLSLTGCVNNHASDAVKEYLEKYRNHDEEVISSLHELLRQENLTKEQNEIYELIMKKQYTDLEYKITEEFYNGEEAVVRVLLTVYDYEYSKKEASNEADSDSVTLQLKKMQDETKRVKYTVDFTVRLQDKEWVLETPSYDVLEKIHGLYNYEEKD